MIWPAVIALTLSVLLTAAVRRYARATGRLDRPNERSSHVVATPRGGGLAIVTAVAVAMAIGCAMGELTSRQVFFWLAPAAPIAVAGLLDDWRGLSALARFSVHVAVAIGAVALAGVPLVPWYGQAVQLGTVGAVLASLAVVWSINLFNFMDGIDGLAATQAVFVFGSLAMLTWATDGRSADASALFIIAAGSLGFLLWNWPPAAIFMGDVGSGALGYFVAAAALVTAGASGVSVWTCLALNGAFVADATVTLLRRAMRRERLHAAHRSHAYQKLARKCGSHRQVVVAFMVVNVAWLLPLAALTVRVPDRGALIVIVALMPLVALAVGLGAGTDRELGAQD